MESTVLPAPTDNSNTCVSKSKSSSATSTVDDDHYNLTSISSPSLLSPPPCDRRSYMDDLWKDINLASLHNHPSTAITLRDGPPPTLQDFLTGPAQMEPSVDGSADACSCSHRPPAFAFLSLSSGSDFQYLGNSGGDPSRSGAGVTVPTPFYVKSLGSPYGSELYKRKAAAVNDGDDREKRLMKNRESASRSRAKKQVL